MGCLGAVTPTQFPGYQSPQTSPFTSPLDTRKKLSGPLPPQLDETVAEPGPWEDAGTGWQGECSEGWAGVVAVQGVVLIHLSPPRDSWPHSRE